MHFGLLDMLMNSPGAGAASISAQRQSAWDAIAAMASVDHIIGTLKTTGGSGGMYADTALTTEATNNVPVLGIKAFGASPGSIVTMPHPNPTGFPANSAATLLWFKNETGASSAIAAIFDRGDLDKSLRIHNGALGLNEWETNPGSLSPAKTKPIDCIFTLRYTPGVQYEGLIFPSWYDNGGNFTIFGMATSHGVAAYYYQTIIVRAKIDGAGNGEVWINGVSVHTQAGADFNTTEITVGTNSHTPFIYFYNSVTSFAVGGFTAPQVTSIMTNLAIVAPLGLPTYPILTKCVGIGINQYMGSGWNPSYHNGVDQVPVFTGGSGVAGTHRYQWYYFVTGQPTLFPSADGLLSNHRQVPSSIDLTTLSTGDSLDSLTVDGVNIMSAPVSYAVSTAATVTAIAANINAHQSNYLAVVADSTCIQVHPNNNNYRSDTLAFTATGFTPTMVQTAKGADLIRATYNVKGQIYFGHLSDATVLNFRVTWPVDSLGVVGEGIASGAVTNNF